MNAQRPPVNVWLVSVTLVFAIIGETLARQTQPVYYGPRDAFLHGLGVVAVSPIAIVWLKALWNNLIPRITGWNKIDFWEAAGIMAILAFFL